MSFFVGAKSLGLRILKTMFVVAIFLPSGMSSPDVLGLYFKSAQTVAKSAQLSVAAP